MLVYMMLHILYPAGAMAEAFPKRWERLVQLEGRLLSLEEELKSRPTGRPQLTERVELLEEDLKVVFCSLSEFDDVSLANIMQKLTNIEKSAKQTQNDVLEIKQFLMGTNPPKKEVFAEQKRSEHSQHTDEHSDQHYDDAPSDEISDETLGGMDMAKLGIN